MTGPTDEAALRAQLRGIIVSVAQEVLAVSEDELEAELSLVDTLAADSVALHEFAERLERQLGCAIEPEALHDVESLEDLVELVARSRR